MKATIPVWVMIIVLGACSGSPQVIDPVVPSPTGSPTGPADVDPTATAAGPTGGSGSGRGIQLTSWTRSIYGRVTGPDRLPLIADVRARLVRPRVLKHGSWEWPDHYDGHGFDTTTRSGSYQLTNLPAGRYEISVLSRIRPAEQFIGIVDVREEARARLDASVRPAKIDGPAGRVSGRVRTDSDQPVIACVTASPYATGSGTLARTFTRPDGRYDFRVEVGEYRLEFEDCDIDVAFWTHYYGGASGGSQSQLGRRSATPVSVAPGRTTQADITVSPAPAVTGRVVDEEGGPLADICVGLFQDDELPEDVAYTNRDGVYTLGPARDSAHYTVRIAEAREPDEHRSLCFWQESWRYQSTYYPGYEQEPRIFRAGHTSVALDDVVLHTRPRLTGRVTTASGVAAADVCIGAFDPTLPEVSEWTSTWPDGTFELFASHGERQIAFSTDTCEMVARDSDQWYSGAQRREDAAILSLVRGTHHPGIDAQL